MQKRDSLTPVAATAAERLRANAALLEMIADRRGRLSLGLIRSLAADLRAAADSLNAEQQMFAQSLRRAA